MTIVHLDDNRRTMMGDRTQLADIVPCTRAIAISPSLLGWLSVDSRFWIALKAVKTRTKPDDRTKRFFLDWFTRGSTNRSTADTAFATAGAEEESPGEGSSIESPGGIASIL